ncbi:MAG: DUF533 domain-containing protein [Defluviicoccus sp.]|nr:DUF533 domain-containing protein [Defluviicoccus sp.]MDG4609331.1 DUF533 domain-containing protein [Defluviicoccus sp.]
MFDPNDLLNTMLSSGTRGSPMSDLLAGLNEGGGQGGSEPGVGGLGGRGPAGPGAGGLGDVLGGMLGGGGLGGSGGGMAGGGMGGGGLGGGLGDLLGGILGGGGGMAGGAGMAGGGGGLGDLLGGLLGGMAGGGMAGGGMGGGGGMAGGGGGGLGDLLGGMLGGGRGTGGGGMAGGGMGGGGGGILDGLLGGLFGGRGGPSKMSGLALIAALAMTLLQSRKSGAAPGAQSAMQAIETTHGADEETAARKALLLIRGMIAAAKADGVIDAEERARIIGKLREAGASAEALAYVEQDMAGPLNVDAIVAEVKDEQTAAELFLASMFAINVDTPAEKAYLAQLADRLGLQAQPQA